MDKQAETHREPLASEIYQDLKKSNRFKERLIYTLIGIIAVLIVGMIGQGIYHNWRWSQFDRVAVDSQNGPATYVQGENTGGVNIGASSSPSEEGQQGQGDAG